MEPLVFAWILFGLYLVGTFFLAWMGHRKTKSFADFAVGKRDMGPGVAGLTLGACLASTATFVINPGFVYAYGLPALVALTIPLFAGVFAGLLVLGPNFRKFGARATTLPVWIGQRYGSSGLRAWFAGLSVLHLFYVVLIVGGAAFVLKPLIPAGLTGALEPVFASTVGVNEVLGVDYQIAVTVVVAVVFSYVFLGGTYAHAYTNTAQGAVMLVMAGLIAFFALSDIGTPAAAAATLEAQDPHLTGLVHPESPFYRHWAEVIVCPFLIGFALVAQPHLLVKTLYLRDAKDMAKFTLVGGGCFVAFSLVLLSGLAARLELGGELAQDVAASTWLGQAFPPLLGALVSVAIIAAAMSTLDGLLVAVSAIVGGDLAAHPAVTKRLGIESEEARNVAALWAGRATVVVVGGVAWAVAQFPPALLGIFGTIGTYGLLVASLPAIFYGVVCKRPPSARGVALASLVALSVHLGLYYGGWTINTGLTAVAGLLVSLPVPFLSPRPERAEEEVETAPRAAAPAAAPETPLALSASGSELAPVG